MEDLTQARKERVGEIMERVHSQLQAVLTEAGIEPDTARRIAATRLYYVLPEPIREAMAEAERSISERLITLFGDIEKAGKEGVKAVPLE